MGSGIESGRQSTARGDQSASRVGGLTGWLLGLFAGRRSRRAAPRLTLVERIALAPRQSLALVEAEGRRILVATSADGAAAFFPLDGGARPAVQNQSEGAAQSSSAREPKPVAIPKPRVSW